MAGVPSGMELCPYCRKPFKRLKSHLPHCKMAGEMKTAFDSVQVPSAHLDASDSKPVRLLAPEKIKGQSKEKVTTTDSGSKRESKKKPLDKIRNKVESKLNPLQIGGSARLEIASSLPAEKPGKNTKWQIKLASEKRHRDEGMNTDEEAKMHMNAAKERTSKAKKLPTTQEIQNKNTSGDKNSAPGGILELSSLNKDGISASSFSDDTTGCSAQQKQRKVESPTQKVAGSLDLLTGDPESIPRAAIEGVKVVVKKPHVKVLRDRNEYKSQGALADCAPTGNCMSQAWYVEILASGCSERHADIVQSDHWKNPNTTAFAPEVTETNTWSGEQERDTNLAATEMHVLSDHAEADCMKVPSELIQQDRVDTSEAERKLFYLNGDVDSKASPPASLAKKPHPTTREALRETSERIASKYLPGTQQLLAAGKHIPIVSESVLDRGRRDSELPLKQHLFHTPKNQPVFLSKSSGQNVQARSLGLEWFPELYPSYQRLNMFPGRPLQVDVEIKMKKMGPSFLEGPQVPLGERCLMDVQLRELPGWLAACDFSPKGVLRAGQRAWSRYYTKYIDVKRGGAAGISMLLAGYCILSYGWRYNQIKQDCWRKYH